MKLKAYSRNNPLKHIIFHTAKRYLWLPFVMFALAVLVFIGTELIIDDRRIVSLIQFEHDLKYAFHNAELWEYFPIILLLLSVFAAYVMFSFLFKKKNSTMMLLTGVSRVELFAVRYFYGLLSTLVPVLVTFLLLFVRGALNLGKSISLDKGAFVLLAIVAVLIISGYTVAVIAISLCGRKLEFFAVCTVFVLSGIGILSFIGMLGNTFLHGFAYPIRSADVNYKFADMLDKYSWLSITGIFKDVFYDIGYSLPYTELGIPSTRLILFSLFSVALIPLAVWIFKRRKAEFDGKSNANKSVSAVCSLLPAFAFSLLIFILGGTFLNAVIVLAVFSLLSLLFYAFFNGTVRDIFKALRFILPATAMFAVLILMFNFDLIGYSNWIPDIDKVESVVVGYKGNSNSFYGSSSGTNFDITSSLSNMTSLPILT